MKKRIISYFVCAVLALSVIGCGSEQISETTQDITIENENTTTVISSSGNILGYENKIFDTSYVHAIDIIISEEDWKDLLENPTDKTKYEVNVKIDGEELASVSFATKGNSSLANVASSESDRYSFKLNFGKFIENQTYYGLDKLNLQNIYADATYMKDYFSYEIMREVGVNAPLASYTTISINGELMGLYLALEDIDESFLERNYG